MEDFYAICSLKLNDAQRLKLGQKVSFLNVASERSELRLLSSYRRFYNTSGTNQNETFLIMFQHCDDMVKIGTL